MHSVERLALRVRRLRMERDLKQRELSLSADQAVGWICDLERGQATSPTLKRIIHLADALDVNPSDLVRTLDSAGRLRIVDAIKMLAGRLSTAASDGVATGDSGARWVQVPHPSPAGSRGSGKGGPAKVQRLVDVGPTAREDRSDEAKGLRKEAVRFRLEAVGETIRALRVRKEWSQATLSEKAEVTSQYMGVVERGESNVSVEALEKIAESLGVAPSDLVLVLDDEHSARRTIRSMRFLLDDLENLR